VKEISIITPTYNEVENITEWLKQVKAIIDQYNNYKFELIVIDNASTDGTQEQLRRLIDLEPRLKVILNSRNFGPIRSPFYGLLQGSGDAVICLAADLQDPPALISQMIEEWEQGAKAVVAIKDTSDESQAFFFIRKLYYRVVDRLADIQTIQNFTGFGLYDRAIVDYCRSIKDPYPYFRGLISEIGLPVKKISFHQPVRKRGFSNCNWYVLYDVAMLGITNFSKVPLRLAAILGFGTAFMSLVVAFCYLIYKLVFWRNFPLGTAPLVIGLFFFSSVQLFFIGILGEYIGAIHTQVLKRPLVVEKERINF
jgi:glycosyltransferase involved in cell wall biosynthesis